MRIICPIHNTESCIKSYKKFPKNYIINMYKDSLNIDVSEYFNKLEVITLYKCEETQYCFFSPPELMGDSKFYDQISKNDWYYLQWKWENEQALKWINSDDVVLEIACGNGDFIKAASKKVKYCVGFDINAKFLKNEKIEILNSDYITFFQKNVTQFDVIISFQFLEHIYDVNEFFKLVKDALKPNGKLILAVPDNKSIIVKNESSTNYPLHHMGWWTKKSLKKTCEFFGFKILYLKTEPLNKNYVNIKHNINVQNISKKFANIGEIIYKRKIIFKFFDFLYFRFPKLFKGHSFIIIAEKL